MLCLCSASHWWIDVGYVYFQMFHRAVYSIRFYSALIESIPLDDRNRNVSAVSGMNSISVLSIPKVKMLHFSLPNSLCLFTPLRFHCWKMAKYKDAGFQVIKISDIFAWVEYMKLNWPIPLWCHWWRTAILPSQKVGAEGKAWPSGTEKKKKTERKAECQVHKLCDTKWNPRKYS